MAWGFYVAAVLLLLPLVAATRATREQSQGQES